MLPAKSSSFNGYKCYLASLSIEFQVAEINKNWTRIIAAGTLKNLLPITIRSQGRSGTLLLFCPQISTGCSSLDLLCLLTILYSSHHCADPLWNSQCCRRGSDLQSWIYLLCFRRDLFLPIHYTVLFTFYFAAGQHNCWVYSLSL